MPRIDGFIFYYSYELHYPSGGDSIPIVSPAAYLLLCLAAA
jgi:hypothetical protein